MYSILFDCDPGHDDVIALMVMLAHPETFRILGITTVAGNQTVEKVTDNALKVLDYLGFPEIPVSRGAARPLCREPEPQPQAHGESGLDGPQLPPAVSRPTGEHAVTFLKKTLEAADQPVTLLATAPLTNLALLLQVCPQAREKIDRICLMGGSLYGGNILPRAEFNIYHDPEAAKIVFTSGIPIVMSGLEVCHAAGVPLEAYPALRGGGKASQLTVELLDFYTQYSRVRGLPTTDIFDLTPVVELLRPDLFTGRTYAVDVETQGLLCRGMTVADLEGTFRTPKSTRILTGVDRDAYVRIFLDSIRALDRRCR